MADDEWASLREEVSRKAADVAHGILHKHLVEGELTAKETRIALEAIYDTVSGIVPWDIATPIYSALKELELR